MEITLDLSKHQTKITTIIFDNRFLKTLLRGRFSNTKNISIKIEIDGVVIETVNEPSVDTPQSMEDFYDGLFTILKNNNILSQQYLDEYLNNRLEIMNGFELADWITELETLEPLNEDDKIDEDDGVYHYYSDFSLFNNCTEYQDLKGISTWSSSKECEYRYSIFGTDVSALQVAQNIRVNNKQLVNNKNENRNIQGTIWLTETERDELLKQVNKINEIEQNRVVAVFTRLCPAISWYEEYGCQVFMVVGNKLLVDVSGRDFDNKKSIQRCFDMLFDYGDLNSIIYSSLEYNKLDDNTKAILSSFGVNEKEIQSIHSQELNKSHESIERLSKSLEDLENLLEDTELLNILSKIKRK